MQEPSVYTKTWNPDGVPFRIIAKIVDKHDGHPPEKHITLETLDSHLPFGLRIPNEAAREFAADFQAAVNWEVEV